MTSWINVATTAMAMERLRKNHEHAAEPSQPDPLGSNYGSTTARAVMKPPQRKHTFPLLVRTA
eukprot:CAMPEP_0184412394 /NCGR_PEP_ID=MMETSP0738-20130409/6409_1 /TAXON_ID=385413 /ORGANISM="Thalassiosira miniscula, Strain CCMP1093" /LENGTH=62 /DNA_ID=CAMNT_0026770875 /DNA_START=381 /DNA_END=565 /DNA_ORIENTATION=+